MRPGSYALAPPRLVCPSWQGRLLELFKKDSPTAKLLPSSFPSTHIRRSMDGPSSVPPTPERDPGATPNIPSLHNLDKSSLAFVINHVFLPPKLPSESDCTPKHGVSLIRVFKDCAETFARRFEPQSNSRTAWDATSRMLASMELLHGGGIIEEGPVNRQIAEMKVGGEQSGLTISRSG